MRTPAKRLRRNPFTLVEIVVAMAIMTVVALIIGSASAIFYNSYRRSVQSGERLREYLAIDRVCDTGIRNMVPFRWRDSNNESRFVFSGETERLLFTALRRADGDTPGGLIFIRLSLEENDLIAEYSFYPRLPWAEEEDDAEIGEFRREVLARNVSSISFLYAEESGEDDHSLEWLEVWDEEEHDAIPLAIQITVEWLDGTREQWLRRAAGVAGRSRFGVRNTVQSGSGGTTGGRTR